jgi:ParB/RepB/Spo0J family partition protein
MESKNNAQKVPVLQIYVEPGRARKDFDPVKLVKLKESIEKTGGLIQPIVVTKAMVEGQMRYKLVAGERRYRACMMAGISEVDVIERSEMTQLEYRICELEENVGRQDLTWEEEAMLTYEIDQLHKKKYGDGGSGQSVGWTQDKTAKLVGASKQTVSDQIRMAKKIKERPDLAEKIRSLPFAAALNKIDQLETTERVEKLRDEGKIKTFTNFLNGDCTVLIGSLEDESIDCGIMDAPFGIPDLEVSRGNTQVYTSLLKPTDNLTATEVCSLMDKLAPELFRVLKPGAHLWMFFGWTVYEHTKKALQATGFDVVEIPIIWYKGLTTGRFSGYQPAPCYEQILLAHRGPRQRRLKNTMRYLLEYKPVPESKNTHPFEKPKDLLQFLIEQSTDVGNKVLDCFAGTGSTIRTAAQLGRSGIGFELDKDHYNKGQELLNEDLKMIEKERK